MTNGQKAVLYRLYSFLAYLVPMVTLFCINKDKYITEGGAFGFFGYIVLVFVVVSFKNAFVSLIKSKTLLTVSVILFLFSLLMRYLADEMMIISFFSLIGASLQLLFQFVADVYEANAYVVENGIKRKNRAPALSDAQAWKEAYL